jgi:hypothetical protein
MRSKLPWKLNALFHGELIQSALGSTALGSLLGWEA